MVIEMILTDKGYVGIESLKEGDSLTPMDMPGFNV